MDARRCTLILQRPQFGYSFCRRYQRQRHQRPQGALASQYFAGASGFPDFMVYRFGMLQSGKQDVKLAGFYNNDWELDAAGLVQAD